MLAMCLNVIHDEGKHLSRSENEAILTKFHKQFHNNHTNAGFLIVLDSSPHKMRPHWHGIFLAVEEHEVAQAWHRACKGHHAWTRIDPIRTSIGITVDYAFKVWGEHRNGNPVGIPAKGVKVLNMRNFFKHATKQSLATEIKALKPKHEHKPKRWEPTLEQMLSEVVTRPTWEEINSLVRLQTRQTSGPGIFGSVQDLDLIGM